MATTKFVVEATDYVVVDRKMLEIKRQLLQRGGSPLNPAKVADALQWITEGRFAESIPRVTLTVLPLTVDCIQSLEQMIAAGQYDAAHPDITEEHFPITGTGIVEEEVILVHFGRAMGDDDVTRELTDLGMEDVPIEHLLAFGAKYPDLQREFPIVARGSSWVDPRRRRGVPCLGLWVRERKLRLDYLDGGWHDHYRFLVCRKKQ